MARYARFGLLHRRDGGSGTESRARAFALFAFLYLVLWGCASAPVAPNASASAASGLIVSVAFAPDSRVWRVHAAADRIYLDYSDDFGMSYSAPLTVNETPQRIRALPEDRPGLAADKSGRIAVVYYAEESHGVVPYFSYSLDRGQHFSSPRALNTPGSEAEHAMMRLAADSRDRVYLFWYETRAHDLGGSLYYTVSDKPEMLSVPDRRITTTLCECCRLAVDFDRREQPVLLARVIFPGSIRDHALITLDPESTRRVTNDDWHIEACPKHGPALSIAADGRYHIAWFTQGEKRQGLFYAYADDPGQSFSQPMRFGNPESLPEHADVLALGERVVLTWKEFDGQQTRLLAMQSHDRGNNWSAVRVIGESNSESDQPHLITNGQLIFASWSALDNGHRLIAIP